MRGWDRVPVLRVHSQCFECIGSLWLWGRQARWEFRLIGSIRDVGPSCVMQKLIQIVSLCGGISATLDASRLMLWIFGGRLTTLHNARQHSSISYHRSSCTHGHRGGGASSSCPRVKVGLYLQIASSSQGHAERQAQTHTDRQCRVANSPVEFPALMSLDCVRKPEHLGRSIQQTQV